MKSKWLIYLYLSAVHVLAQEEVDDEYSAIQYSVNTDETDFKIDEHSQDVSDNSAQDEVTVEDIDVEEIDYTAPVNIDIDWEGLIEETTFSNNFGFLSSSVQS